VAIDNCAVDAVADQTVVPLRLCELVDVNLMLATEIGLRVLGRDRAVPCALSGKIEFEQWGTIIGQIRKAVDCFEQWPKSALKAEAQRFYGTALLELSAFNDGYRTDLSHARNERFDPADALALYGHVDRFFRTIAERLSEAQTIPLDWRTIEA
jgi:hypothetical protein